MARAEKPSIENWLRLACMVYDELQPALLNILHNTHNDGTYKGLSQNGPDLYKELDLYRPQLTALIKKKILNRKQFELLLPQCQSTNSSKFDITILVAVIRNCLNIPAPSSWNFRSLDKNDMSIASYIVRGKEIRNKVCHCQPCDIDDNTFNTYWKEGEIVLRGLRHQCDMNALMSHPLDARTLNDKVKLDKVQDKVNDLGKDLVNLKSDIETIKTGALSTTTDITSLKKDFGGVKFELKDVRSTLDSVQETLKEVAELQNISTSSSQTKGEVDQMDLKDTYKKMIMNCRSEKNEKHIIKRKFNPDKCPEVAIMSREAVLIRAAAGVGKTIYATDLLHRWASNNILTDYFVLKYNCKDLNKHAKMTADMSPIYFSRLKELSTNKGQQLFADCKRMMDSVESFLQQGKLIVLIDGVDEIALEQYLTVDAMDILRTRIDTGEKISGLDTLAAIMFGLVLLNTKIIVSGRNTDIEQMQRVKGGSTSNVFNEDERTILELKEFSDIDVQKLVHLNVCGAHDDEFEGYDSDSDDNENSDDDKNDNKNNDNVNNDKNDNNDRYRRIWTMDTKCKDVYNRFQNVKFKNNPSLLSHLIAIYENNAYSERMGTITKTKLFIAVILNHLHKHTELGKTMTHTTFHQMFSTQGDEFKHCLQSLAAISYHGILNQERKVFGVKEGTTTKYHGVELNDKICEKIDMFYVKPEENSVEARHMMFMEFLCAVYFALHKDSWDTLAKLTKERKIVILPFVKFKNNPSLLSHLIVIYENDLFSERMRTITKTKLFIAVILNHLHKHTELGKTMTHPTFHHMFSPQGDEFKHCLQSLSAMSYHGILNQERKVIGVREGTTTKYHGVELNEKICGKIDMFYVKPEENSVEARHMMFMEFLCAVHYALHKDTWDTLNDLTRERKIVILPFVAGLLAHSSFVKDFVNCMGTQVHTTTDLYESLFADDSKFTYQHGDEWHGVWYNRDISFKLLNTMRMESHAPDTRFLPNDLVYYAHDNSPTNIADMFHLKYMKDIYGLGDDQNINLPSFCERYPSVRITIKGAIGLYTDEDVLTMNMVVAIPQVHTEMNGMYIVNDEGSIDSYQFLHNISTDWLSVSGRHQQFPSIIDTIAQNNTTTSCVGRLRIGDVDKVSPNTMNHVLGAARKVEMLHNEEPFTTDQREVVSRLLEVNHYYRNITMVTGDKFLEEEQSTKRVSHFLYIHLPVFTKMTDDSLDTLTKSSHHPSYHRYYGDATQQYSLHQYQVQSLLHPLIKIDGGHDYMFDENDTGVLMLNTYSTNLSKVSPETFARSLSNIPVVCVGSDDDEMFFDHDIITSDQLEAFGRVVNEGNASIRELRLWNYNITDMSLLLLLSSIPLLQIIGYNKKNLFQQLLQYIVDNITEKYLRIFVTKGRGDSYNERVIFDGPITKTKKKSVRNLIENEMKELRFSWEKDDDIDDNEEDYFDDWIIELTNPSKDKCSLM